MATREEIREGIRRLYPMTEETDVELHNKMVCIDELLRYLDSQGLVLKVDRELPKCRLYGCHVPMESECPLVKAGYEAVESLIGGDNEKTT